MWSPVPCAGARLHATMTDTVPACTLKYFSHRKMHPVISKRSFKCNEREKQDAIKRFFYLS